MYLNAENNVKTHLLWLNKRKKLFFPFHAALSSLFLFSFLPGTYFCQIPSSFRVALQACSAYSERLLSNGNEKSFPFKAEWELEVCWSNKESLCCLCAWRLSVWTADGQNSPSGFCPLIGPKNIRSGPEWKRELRLASAQMQHWVDVIKETKL